jgi:hypothetical protein
VDFNCDFGGRVVGICCYGLLDLGRVVEECLVQGFELVLAVVDGVCSAVDCGGLDGGEGREGHCGGLVGFCGCCNLAVVLLMVLHKNRLLLGREEDFYTTDTDDRELSQ